MTLTPSQQPVFNWLIEFISSANPGVFILKWNCVKENRVSQDIV